MTQGKATDARNAGTDVPTPPAERLKHGQAPIGDFIGFQVIEAVNGRAVVTLQTGPHLTNPMGTLHGGILCDIADSAMGTAFATTIAPDESFTTVELKINYFRPVWNTLLRAEGRVINRGKTMGYMDCDITDESGKLIAKAGSSCMVLRADKATGR